MAKVRVGEISGSDKSTDEEPSSLLLAPEPKLECAP